MDGTGAVRPQGILAVGNQGRAEGPRSPDAPPRGRSSRTRRPWFTVAVVVVAAASLLLVAATAHIEKATETGLLVAWAAVVGAVTASVFRRERDSLAAEDALRSGQERLEDVVAERTGALRAAHLALLSAQEQERKRIATELHDQLGHALILMKFRIALVARAMGAAQEAARRECAELCAFIDQTLDDVRRLARDLRPSVLEELGLSAALRWMAENCGHDEQRIAATVEDVDDLVAPDAQMIVYRIVQQALTNAARHSLAESVSLRVMTDRRCVWFVVEDDGEGFDTTKIATGAAAGALGLTTMQERASIIGGSLDVWSAPGSGTRVSLGVPVPPAKETT